MIQRHFKLALTAGHSLPLVINANQYDSGEQWLFTLYSDGVKYTPSTGAIVGIKADRLGIINTGSVDEAGRVVINETRQMTAAVGKNIFELLIDDQTHGTANFMVLVEPRPGDNADLSESDYSLFEEAIQGTSAAAIAQGVSDWMDDNLTPTTPVVDQSLTVQGAAADAKKTGDEISALKSAIEQGSSLTSAIKSALLQLAQKVAYIDENGQTYYDDLYDALYPPIVVTAITLNTNSLSFATLNSTQQLTATTTPVGGEVVWSSSNPSVATVSATGLVTAVAYGNATITATSGNVSATCSVVIAQATVTSISAVYSQGSKVIYDTDSLDSLKSDLVVTATWSNQTTSTVASADYTLSGTLTVGTSTITVSYAGKTTTFNVTVSKAMYSAINITDIPWTSGYTINNNGELEADANSATWDSFISGDYGTGFMYLKNGTYTTNNLTISEYDTNESFLSKTVGQRYNFAKNQSSKFIKVTVSNSLISNSDLILVGMQRVPDSILTYTNMTLNNNGETEAMNGRNCSDFIDISAYQFAYAAIGQIESGIVLCFYDSSHTFISRYAATTTPTLMGVPANAKYIRIACINAVSSFLL